MTTEESSENTALAKSPPLSPTSAHFSSVPPIKPNGETANISTSTSELEDKSANKPEKKGPPSALPLSSTVSPASLYSVLPASGLSNQLNVGPSVINKQLLSKLNKSLKEKQKVINAKETFVRNPALIQEVMSPSLQQSFNVSGNSTDVLGAPNNVPLNESMDLDRAVESDVCTSNGGQGKDDAGVKAKSKQVAKQNSTRTDFFAAKLAIAVDDVESSDSDETFIYETNVNEYGADDPGSLPPPISQEESRKATISIQNDNANAVQKPPAPLILSETSSLNGSLRVNPAIDSHANSPTTELRKEDDSSSIPMPLQRPSVTKAESIHSLQSIKYNLRNTFNTTPPAASNGRSQSITHPSYTNPENLAYSNPYFDQNTKSKSNGRDGVQMMTSDEDERDAGIRCSLLHYGDSTLMQYGVNEELTNAPSLNEPYADTHFSYDEDDVVSGEESSSHDDINLVCTDSNANNILPASIQRPADLASVSSKAKKTKSSTASSKLRSTTSKLFDKKGAQPRRYSTIPDDIDIEDFDDELIYYDNNNIRFPYGNNNDHSNESSSLVGGPKIPHYRSLNLNFGARKPSKNAKSQRYLSLSYVPSPVNGKKRNDIFPFPYLEHEQPYLDFDEYDEGPKISDQLRGKRLSSGRNHFTGNGDYGSTRYSNQDTRKGSRAAFIRSLIYTFVAITFILSLGFILGFFLASTKDLSNVIIVSIENPLVSQDELVFSIVIEALNPGWFTISIEDVELDIFAKSGYLDEESAQSSLETVLLGSVLNFESAVFFEGLFFHRKRSRHTGEIKLVSPGKNITGSKYLRLVTESPTAMQPSSELVPTRIPDNSEKWAIISKHPFDLILRGVLKYNLPLISTPKTVVVNKVGYVDPSIPS